MALTAMLAAMGTLVLAAATAYASSPEPIGLPGCNTTCGSILVPYPFGIQPGCYRPGFNLSCDTSHGSPRLLLGDGSLRVVDIFIQNATVRVLQDKPMAYGDNNGLITNVTFASMFAGGHYWMSTLGYELVLFGCDVLATLVAGKIRPVGDSDSRPSVIGCASFCAGEEEFGGQDSYCDGAGCCQASFHGADWAHMPTELHMRPLVESRKNNSRRDIYSSSQVSVFLAEKGWLDRREWQMNWADQDEPQKKDIPLILRWDIMHGLTLSDADQRRAPDDLRGQGCPRGVTSLCKSNKSECISDVDVYQCRCKPGYDGNPYLDGGCQDMDECDNPESNSCFGDCTNTDGSFECRCQNGTFGDATVKDGCLKTPDSSTDGLQMPGMAPVPIGQPKCETICGDVHVPYPFGFGSSWCYVLGFELTCDKGHNPPRLLLGGGDSTFQVTGISLNDTTVHVTYTNTFDITTCTDRNVVATGRGGSIYFDKQVGVRFLDINGSFMLSARNEFILTGCNVEATLQSSTGDNIVSCVSNCTSGVIGNDGTTHTGEYCSGTDGCCHVRIPPGSWPKSVKFKQLLNTNISQKTFLPPLAFVAEEGHVDHWYMIFNLSTTSFYRHLREENQRNNDMLAVRRYAASEVPLVLQWMLKQNISSSAEKSDCWRESNGGYTCHCKKGFYGNPYVIGGCQDIDECKDPKILNSCFGECNNFPGYHECRCPRGSHGDPYQSGGCIKSITGLTIGLLVSSGPILLLLVLCVALALYKAKQRRVKLRKQKYFKQNRGQLLQQLISQRADIAEKMIIPLEELEKATNNFDESRTLGGGGHGTVYKGILSDLHVVAIKKSKVTIQREIDEFINEVAILSQINHRNVVKLLGCCLETEVPLLVYEFISNGTLHSHLHREDTTGSLPWRDRLRIASETAKAIAYLHSSVSIPIIHRDIKSANILLDDALTAKVSDFGASRYVIVPTNQNEATTTAVQGTIGYLDPMYYYTRRMTKMSDVYSFGVVLVELLTRKSPTSYKSQEGNGLVAQFNTLHTEGNLDQILDPQVIAEGGLEVEEVVTLAALCIKYRGEERPTMRQVEMALEALQAPKEQVQQEVAVDRSEIGNILTNHFLARRRTNMDQVSRRLSMEEEFLLSASYPR